MDDLILDVRHLSHRFKLTRKLAVQALDDLSFQVRRGEIFGRGDLVQRGGHH